MWFKQLNLMTLVVLTEGPSAKRPETNNRMEIIDLGVRPDARKIFDT